MRALAVTGGRQDGVEGTRQLGHAPRRGCDRSTSGDAFQAPVAGRRAVKSEQGAVTFKGHVADKHSQNNCGAIRLGHLPHIGWHVLAVESCGSSLTLCQWAFAIGHGYGVAEP
jgi:hypothetical protein